MWRLKGPAGKDICDSHVGLTRRDVLRVGGAGMLGMSLGTMLQLQAQAAGAKGGAGWGKAKSIIMCYLQGGPSHLDLWDPKPEAPENVRSIFNPISTKIPGVQFTDILPKLSKINEKAGKVGKMVSLRIR